MNKQVSTIFFDIGGVLLNIHPERTLQHLSECTGVHIDKIKNRFTSGVHQEYEKGNLSNK
jgi:FMN phosphatase YigB (HAD superfamily)